MDTGQKCFLNDGLPKLSVRFSYTDVDDTRVKVSKDVIYETVKIISKLHVTGLENDGDTGRQVHVVNVVDAHKITHVCMNMNQELFWNEYL